eukprot:TRINITY_DN3825_c0_g1_i4.p1 TRINITY_DN3825_c0_g1~~TRINITY_DN3825_c0_g1_i4.p1  ORF type:complete len:125 (-),score=11.21 TRINITY_DN3825_c0_g1_i4:20-394(-)
MASYSSHVDRYIETLEQCKLLTDTQVQDLCKQAKGILSEEPNVLELRPPINICGSIEGNFPALQEIFKVSYLISLRYLLLLIMYTANWLYPTQEFPLPGRFGRPRLLLCRDYSTLVCLQSQIPR